MDYHGVELKVLDADALSYPSDLLVLKHAQASYGVDKHAIRVAGIDVTTLPAVGDSLLIPKPANLASRNLLLLGVEPVYSFDYRSIRNFSRRALARAVEISPPVREISMTLHGIGFGLDEIEAFESEAAGIIEALDSGEYPKSLVAVSIVELNTDRADRMRKALAALLASGYRDAKFTVPGGQPPSRRVDSVGYDSEERPHAFVESYSKVPR